ncbi:TOPRIM domain-containing protein [Caballeronia glebae]|uniref:TOPRIM domain-containing protein n=1 Tax=Caballeronia glebae TaxID=1777143 RepID=A0A158A001_9BURK|nr:AAA family ATPase [Caballeronia glebae]SAK51059.1 TOPRIM domain-containing protein [Caballeronia glebae]
MFLTRRDPSEAADINIISTNQVVAENTEWLLPGFLPKKKLSLLAGTPGAGKTSIALYYAATISSGGTWPDGSRAEPGRVLMYVTEDGVADTIKPRLAAMGADLRNVEVIDNTTEISGRGRRFDCQRDLGVLQQKLIGKGGYALVVIDPVTSIVAGNTNNNQVVRDALESLVRFAEAVGCAVLCLTHVSKGSSRRSPLERVMGGLAYGAVPRMVLIAARVSGRTEDGLQRGVLVRAKTNIASTDGGFEYLIQPVEVQVDGKVIQTSRIGWSSELLEGSADEILKSAAGDAEEMPGGELGRAAEFLLNVLANGSMLCSEVESLAVAAGISSTTLKRARKRVGVLSSKQTGAGPHSPSVLCLRNAPVGASGVGNVTGGLPFGPAATKPGQWFPGSFPGYPAYGSASNGTSSPFIHGAQFGLSPVADAGVPYADARIQYPPYVDSAAMSFRGSATGSQEFADARAQRGSVGPVGPVGSVGPVGPVGPVKQPKPPQPDDKPAWVSEENWDWLRQGYRKEYKETTRFDHEDESNFRARVGRAFLDASCSEWERKDELCSALVEDFNRFSYLDSLRAAF